MKKIYILLTLLLAFFSFKETEQAITNISINNNKLIPEFEINTKVYNVFVSSKTEIIGINVEPSEGEIITGSGSKSLKKGLNVIEISSYINDTLINTYTLNIVRGDVINDKKDATLKNLKINNHEIDFSSEIFTYKINTSDDEKRIDITYEPTNPNSIIKLKGDVNLTKEKNIIKITVISEDKKTTNTYTIKVYKDLKVTQKKEKKSSVFDGKNFNSYELKLIIILIISFGLILIGALFYFIFIKKRKKYCVKIKNINLKKINFKKRKKN